MKQCDLCRIANVPKSSLSLYLSGKYEPKQDRIYAMAKALDVNEAWLMGYDVAMDNKHTESVIDSPLSDGERLLLDLFRKVSEDKQQLVIQMIRVALNTKG